MSREGFSYVYSNLYHYDNYITTYLKCYINLQSVTDNDGPLHIIEADHVKDYFISNNVEDVRTKFHLRTKMVDAKLNFENKKNYSHELWLCDSCETSIESQSHLLWCPAYQNLREGKDLSKDNKRGTRVYTSREDRLFGWKKSKRVLFASYTICRAHDMLVLLSFPMQHSC